MGTCFCSFFLIDQPKNTTTLSHASLIVIIDWIDAHWGVFIVCIIIQNPPPMAIPLSTWIKIKIPESGCCGPKVKSSSNFIFGPQQPFSGICQFRPTQLDSSWYIKTKFDTAVISPQLGRSARPSWLGLTLCYWCILLVCSYLPLSFLSEKFKIGKSFSCSALMHYSLILIVTPVYCSEVAI